MIGLKLVILLCGVLGVQQLHFIYKYLTQNEHTVEEKEPVSLLCYFALDLEWPNNGTLHPALNATLCSHLIFIDTGVKDGEIVVSNTSQIPTYFDKIPLLRQQNPKLKILITNGGGGDKLFTPLLASKANRTKYVSSIIPFLKRYDFDGLDLDFEFPGWGDLPRGQRANFTFLTQELRQAFDVESQSGGKKYLLSAAVAAGRELMVIYDVKALAESLDYLNLMCYDLHSYAYYDPITGYNSPLYPDWEWHIPIISGSVGWSSNEWNKRGMPKSKIMVGVPTYSHSWTLEFPDKYNGTNSPAVAAGKAGDGAAYSWNCEFLRQNGTTKVWDDDAEVPYSYNGALWVSYDDVRSLSLKTEWTIQNGFGGIMVFSMNADDIYGSCGQGRLPLVSAIRDTINKHTGQPSVHVTE